ncbi:phage BR0599 family protein [Wolbachia endosymbiont of Onchocerca ochengi]
MLVNCDKMFSIRESKFNNIVNFCCEPYIPSFYN